jgi:hypothetical protein
VTLSSDNWIPFTNCSIQIAKLPITLFETSGQRTKKQYSGDKRYLLLTKLGGYANADGTNCFPKRSQLAKDMRCAVRTVGRLLDDLCELGFVLDDGFVRNPNSRASIAKKRRLVLPPTAQKALGMDTTDTEDRPDQPAEASA